MKKASKRISTYTPLSRARPGGGYTLDWLSLARNNRGVSGEENRARESLYHGERGQKELRQDEGEGESPSRGKDRPCGSTDSSSHTLGRRV